MAISRRQCLIFVLLTWLGTVPLGVANELQVQKVILSTHDLNPYGYYDSNGKFEGVAYNSIKCTLDNMSIELELHVRPWRRAQLEVEHGVADGFFAGSQNKIRDSYAVRSAEVADQKWQWYLMKNSKWDVTSQDFKIHARVSSFLGANMQKWLTDKHYRITAVPTNTDDLAEMLLIGRIDAALANNYVMDSILAKRGMEDKVRRVVQKSKPLYAYFSKTFVEKHPTFLEVFNQRLKECKQSF